MKNTILAILLITATAPAIAQVGVSISVGEPGFYGQINIGNAPAPQLIYAQPVVIAPAPQFVGVPPIYLRVPPGYAKHWNKHCAQYGACGRPVYFVRDDWYLNRYVPYYRGHRERNRAYEGHYDRQDGRGGWDRRGRGDGNAQRYHERGNQDHGNRGQGRGHGHGRD